jgi:TolB-like protein
MGPALLRVICCVIGFTEMGFAQCPDGTPPPCGAQRAHPAPPPPNVRARRIMLLPFRNVTRAPANDWIITGAPLMLGEALGQFSDLVIVPEQRLTAAMRRFSFAPDVPLDATQLRQLADETGGWTAIYGNVIASGNKLRITAQALDITTSLVVARGETEVAADADTRPAFDRLTVQLLQAVGVRGAAPDLAALTTKSVDAYRSYVDGVSLIQRGAFKRAQIAFSDAVRRDSTFALAWSDLALTSVQAGGWAELLNPMGSAGRAAEQAFRNAARLPARQAEIIRVMHSTFHGEFGRAHRLADSLVTADPEDILAREWLTIIEILDSRLDTTVSQPRRMGSLNRAIEMAKGVLDRDPGRLEVYFMPATIYAFGAGFMGPVVGARRKEVGSLAADFLTPPDVFFAAAFDDSIVLVVDTTYARLPADERARLQLRAANAGLDWTNRWLVAAEDDPEAHLWASRFQEFRGDYSRALQEMRRAESLGVESNLENLRARRLSLLELTGRSAAAEALADSIFDSGGLRSTLNPWIDRSRIYVTAVFLRSKQWDKAAALAKLFGVPAGQPTCGALATQLTGYSLKVAPSEQRAIADTVAAHRDELLRIPELAPCANALAQPPR